MLVGDIELCIFCKLSGPFRENCLKHSASDRLLLSREAMSVVKHCRMFLALSEAEGSGPGGLPVV